jgi:hypothetical protein
MTRWKEHALGMIVGTVVALLLCWIVLVRC